jgi:RNA-directed DNA polymerase
MHGNLEHVSTIQQRIAELARTKPELAFTSLAHHMTLDWLYEAYRRTRKDGAAGVDAVTGKEYGESLHENLQTLLERLKAGRYRAAAVRRKDIPKGTSGETRPIGIPTFEDKIVQRAVVMLLEPIYEQDFYNGSYGFRPKRSAHDALHDVWDTTMRVGGGWVLEVDIRKFFDTLDHKQLQEFVSVRVRDGVLRRLIGKWLNAGVMAGDTVTHPDAGTPQGGVISPLLANIYLHYVLDVWFVNDVRPRMDGRCRLIRYADDLVIVFEKKHDAERVMEVLPKRMTKYGLTMHPDKTRLIDFRSPNHKERRNDRDNPGGGSSRGGRSETFDLLGFTHYWRKTRKGNWAVRRKTMAKRLTRAIRAVYQWCRKHRHWPVKEQWKHLCMQIRGHNGYYGIIGNRAALDVFCDQVKRAWRKWLNRRNRNRDFTWAKFNRMKKTYPLPFPSETWKTRKQTNCSHAQLTLF